MFAVGSVPIADATNIETENAKIVNEKGNLKVEPVKVEAAYKKTKYKKYKKTYRKKVRASYRTSVRKRYSSKYYKKKRVRAAYSTSTYHYSSIGDCWAMSEYLYKKLTASGEKVRIIQYGWTTATVATTRYTGRQGANPACLWLNHRLNYKPPPFYFFKFLCPASTSDVFCCICNRNFSSDCIESSTASAVRWGLGSSFLIY